MHVMHQENAHGHKGLTPAARGSNGSVMVWEEFCWPQEVSLQTNAVPSGHLYSVTKHFFPHGSSLFEDDSTPFPMAKGFTEWFESLAGAVGAFEPTALLITIIETVQISLDELSSISQDECRVSTDVHANCSDVNTKLRRCMYVFLLICRPLF